MSELHTPIECISITDSRGAITPLRFRLERENRELLRVNVDRVLDKRTVPYVGAEAQVFLCRARVDGTDRIFELKYSIRSHCWYLVQRMY